MRFVALAVAVTALVAGIGLTSVVPVKAHGGDGGGQLVVAPATNSCEAIVSESDAAAYVSCGDKNDQR